MWNTNKIQEEKIRDVRRVNNSSPNNPLNPLWSSMKEATNYTLTENNALTHKNTTSAVLDLFALGGALRGRETQDVEQLISKALAEDFELGLKCLFYLRDVRGGQGERKTFRTGLNILSRLYPDVSSKIAPLVPEYGRWDDIFSLEDVDLKGLILNQLEEDKKGNKCSLLAKWLPSENAGKKNKMWAKAVRKYLGMSPKEYRQTLSELRNKINLVESKMSSNKWNEIEYSKIPSRAGIKYRKAFGKKDTERYSRFLSDVETGKVKMNTQTLYPHELVKKARDNLDKTIESAWKNLPDYTNNENALVVADVSGSMQGTPMDVSIGLAMYFAERNRGIFNNKFITFSTNPSLQEVSGNSLYQKIMNLERADWEMSTNIQAVFDLILNIGIKNGVSQEEMPKTIYIISDMEFDDCCRGCDVTNFQFIKQKYQDAGYNLPQIVFWNVDARNNQVPVTKDEMGTVLVSGSSPSTFEFVMDKTTPYEFMKKVLNSERYKPLSDALK